MAERKRTTRTPKAKTEPVVEEVKATETIPVEAVAPAEKEEVKATSAPIQMVVEQKAPPVKILYVDSVIPNNQIPIGSGRYITGSGRIFTVLREHFDGEFMTPLTMKLIDTRKFVVLSGLTDDERRQYNCYYNEGEVVKSEGVFDSLITLPVEQAVAVYTALGKEHRALAATRFMTAYFENHDNRITRDRVEALNKISKEYDPDGLFTPIVKDINEKSE